MPSLHGFILFIFFYSVFKNSTLLFSNYFYDCLYTFSFLSSAPKNIFKCTVLFRGVLGLDLAFYELAAIFDHVNETLKG